MLDEKDKKILDCLNENSRFSTQKISKKTFIPITTVHHRLKNLKSNGIIKKFTVELDNHKLGKILSAFILAQMDHTVLKRDKITEVDLMKMISSKEEVDKISVVAGESDFIVKISVESIEKLNEFLNVLRNFDAVQRTDTMIILDEM